MYDTTDLVAFATDANPIEFGKAFSSILHSRLVDAIDAKRVEIAQSLYSSED